jgi:hypothetical protein
LGTPPSSDFEIRSVVWLRPAAFAGASVRASAAVAPSALAISARAAVVWASGVFGIVRLSGRGSGRRESRR